MQLLTCALPPLPPQRSPSHSGGSDNRTTPPASLTTVSFFIQSQRCYPRGRSRALSSSHPVSQPSDMSTLLFSQAVNHNRGGRRGKWAEAPSFFWWSRWSVAHYCHLAELVNYYTILMLFNHIISITIWLSTNFLSDQICICTYNSLILFFLPHRPLLENYQIHVLNVFKNVIYQKKDFFFYSI